MIDPYGSEQWMFLILSLMISILSSYTMFYFIGNIGTGSVTERRYGMLGGAVVFGICLSSLHFVALLARDYMITIDWKMLVIFAAGALLAYVSFLQIGGSPRLGPFQASLYLSFAALALHYVNMLGGPLKRIELDGRLLALSAAVIFFGTWTAYAFFTRSGGKSRLFSALLLGCSTVLMIQIGMEAVTVEYTEIMTSDRLNDLFMRLVMVIGFGTLLVPGGGLAAWLLNTRMNTMHERYQLLVENSMDMIAIVSGGKWDYVNKAGLRMFEAEHESELLGKPVLDFLHPKHHEEANRCLHMVEGGRPPASLEQDWYTLRGKLLHTEVVETPTTLAGKPAVQVIIRDISERKKNEELLINSEKLYVAGQLAAGIAHEIRNPLTSLKGFLQLIASGRSEGKNYYEIMKSELNRIESIVSELLMLSKPQIYELAFQDARAIMKDTVTLLEAQAIMHGIVIELHHDDEPLWVHGVENQIKQVFINVLKNAIEAMTGGGSIRIRCMREGGYVIARITDEGPGIDETQLSKMGQPFYTTKDKGTGLGLMVSYKIVDNHRGKIRVSSELGRGTTMDIALLYASPARGEEKGNGTG
ncbi:ATP-binding protein [uncultured Paenibacillus sp.]|uniref:ATP-binding protein n=1 Tax=uncultured Paenibacillus sp. TaxID=227322 RepID=UPI0028D0B1B3|nr:ATP-binding protein [uncultured Paenibacillus sp.]